MNTDGHGFRGLNRGGRKVVAPNQSFSFMVLILVLPELVDWERGRSQKENENDAEPGSRTQLVLLSLRCLH